MQCARVHPHEERRLASLHRLDLDACSERLDRLTELVALVTGSPIALISFVDRDRQWFVSRRGVLVTETDRNISFCAHAIVAEGELPFVIEDTWSDWRFVDNPMVTGVPHVRFYAGQPLRDAHGLPLGTLCVMDRRARTLEPSQGVALMQLGALVEDELHRRTERQLAEALSESEQHKSLILDTVTQGLVLQNEAGVVVQWNPAAERLLGLNSAQIALPLRDQPWTAIHPDGTPWAPDALPAMTAMATGRPVVDATMGLLHVDGHVQWLKVNSRPVLDGSDPARQAVTTFVDITAEVAAADQRRGLEAALRQSEQTARMSLDALEQGVLLADPSGVIHRINPAAEAILGYTAEELASRLFTRAWPTYTETGEALAYEQRPLVRAVATGVPVIGQIVAWEHRNGERRVLRVSCIPGADDAGSVVIAFTDITNEHMAARLLDATFRAAPVGLAVLDTDRRILRCNPAFARQAGRPTEDVVGLDVMDLVHRDDRAAAAAVGLKLRFGDEHAGELDQRLMRPDGAELWVNTHLAVIPDRQRPLAIAATFDVTERRHMVHELARFSYLFHHSNDLIAVVDAGGHQLYISPSAGRILGYPDRFFHPDGILGLVHPDDFESAVAEFGALIASRRGDEPFTVRVLTYTGEVRHLECVGVNLLHEPAVGGVVITGRDVTDRVQLTEQLAHRALHDTLTDLPNRQLLETTLFQALARARRDETQIGLCFIDLDGFKQVNDTFGHATGDRLIVSVADRIRQSIRDGDLAARVGGDEFVVVLDTVSGPAQAVAAATRLRDLLTQNRLDEPGPRSGASVGLAISRRDDTVSSLLNRADAAMYRAKARHNSAVELAFEPDFASR